MTQSLLFSDTKIMLNTCSYKQGVQEIMQLSGKTQKVSKKKITKNLQAARNGFGCLDALNVHNGSSKLSKCGNPEVRHYS